MHHLEASTGSHPRSARPAARAVLLLALAALLGVALPSLLAPAGTAHAASYRFWGYYQLTGSSWAFAQKGPADTTPDGRRGRGLALRRQRRDRHPASPGRPRPSPPSAAATPAKAGSKRVGVVIDSGRPADAAAAVPTPPAPQAACAVVDTAATGAEVLAAVASVRVEKGLTCAINGYPATGCGEKVKQVPAAAKAADTPVTILAAAAASPSASPDAAQPATPASPANSAAAEDSGVSAATWAGIIIVLALVAVVALVALRRRRGLSPTTPTAAPCAAPTTSETCPGCCTRRRGGCGRSAWPRPRPAPPTRSCSLLVVAVAAWVVTARREVGATNAFSAFLGIGLVVDRPAGGDRRAARRRRQRPRGPVHAAGGAAARRGPPGCGWAARSPSRGCSPRRTTGLRLAAILACVGAANALASPRRLLRYVPGDAVRGRRRPSWSP